MLELDRLFFSFSTVNILENFSLRLFPGEIGSLIGVSGSGKTTLFKLISGLLSPLHGTISIASSPFAHQQVAYMAQDDLLLPWRNVLGNLLLVGELGKQCNKKNLHEEALFYLQEVGLKGYENVYPHQLSGGMRQRVSLARILMQKRPLLLLDEPFAALDIGLREKMHSLLKNIRQKHGITMLVITHDFRDALSLSDRIFLLSKGQLAKEWLVNDTICFDPAAFQQLTSEMQKALYA